MDLIAIIGGTGVYDPTILDHIVEETIETPYGPATYLRGDYKGRHVVFMRRHGGDHSIPPHLINYRANIWALKKIGVKKIIATTAVGSCNLNFKAGSFVLCDQFIDFTKNRITTFYEGGDRGVVHLDVTHPYCPCVREHVYNIGKELGLDIHNGGTYVCTEGPRFETPAEVKMFEKLGGDVLGMTNVPEVTLAAEAEMCYITISQISNFAAGISPDILTHQEVLDVMAENSANLKALILKSIETMDEVKEGCHCAHNLEGYGGFKL